MVVIWCEQLTINDKYCLILNDIYFIKFGLFYLEPDAFLIIILEWVIPKCNKEMKDVLGDKNLSKLCHCFYLKKTAHP